jgi:hypothetical protein
MGYDDHDHDDNEKKIFFLRASHFWKQLGRRMNGYGIHSMQHEVMKHSAVVQLEYVNPSSDCE